MPFQLSPGVAVVEKDFTSIVPAVATSVGGFAGSFIWGPVLDPVRISSENDLVAQFGRPTDANADSFFTAANFLSYTSNLLVVRGDATNAKNAVAVPTGTVTNLTLTAGGSGYTSAPTVAIGAPTIPGGVQATATVTLSGGGVTNIAVTAGGTGYTSTPTVTLTGGNGTGATATAVLSAAGIQSIQVSNGGAGYTVAPTIALTGGGGSGATATATVSGGAITAITVTAPGSGYTSAPTVEITADSGDTITLPAAATATLTTRTVTSISVGATGSGYTTAPTVAITGGGGSGAAATATIAASTITSITLTNPGSGYASNPTVTFTGGSGSGATATAVVTVGGIKINNTQDYLNSYINGAGIVGEFAARYPGALGNSLKVSMADAATFGTWAYRAEFDSAPGTSAYVSNAGGTNDELHIIVIDEDGAFTGTQGEILEKFSYISKASDAKKFDGSNNYYKDVINSRSQYIWWMDHPTQLSSGVGEANWGTVAIGATFKSTTVDITRSLASGVDDLALSEGQKQTAFATFVDDSQYDVSLIMLGKAAAATATYVINNVAEVRLDCVVFASPQDVSSGDIIIGGGSAATDRIIAYRNALPSTSYGVLDTGYKYQYDRYNDKYRYVPLNGDIAGLCARTDYTNDPWFSPGGLNRGQIKNVVKLAHNPNKTDRDELYKAGVNPVVTFPGEGTVLFGDKTLLAKPSAFDRINVRRLFIVMEKAIATAAKFQLFEFNDPFTRAQFRSLVEPFLRDVQGRRGITDFVVKCDESNNTGEVIDRNEFVADIFVKPNRSINFITLTFVAARSAINFSEIGG
jgi:hypothetical protein